MTKRHLFSILTIIAIIFGSGSVQAADKIIHDAEYAIIEAQNGEQWAKDDKEIEKKLAQIRKKNGNKPPNIVYILHVDKKCDIIF